MKTVQQHSYSRLVTYEQIIGSTAYDRFMYSKNQSLKQYFIEILIERLEHAAQGYP